MNDRRQQLAHVLWIGGPPDAGKTSIAQRLAEQYGLQPYHFDRREPAHFAQADSERHPAMWAAHPERMTTEARWLGSRPREMAEMTIASWSERVEFALHDLLELPATSGIVAEGPGFFPDVVLPLIDDPRKVVFLVPEKHFKRASALARDKPGNRDETSDPERATENLIQRDLLMGDYIRARAEALGLTVYTVDDTRDLEQMIAAVEAHFAPFLAVP
jgi:hypothetical protein